MNGIIEERIRVLSDGCSQLHLDLFLNECLYSTVHPSSHKRLSLCIQSRKKTAEWSQCAEWNQRVGGGECLLFFSLFFFFLSCYFSFSSYLVFFDTLWQLVQTEEPKKDPPDNLDRKSTCENAISSQCTIRPRRMEIVCFQSTSEAAKNVKHYLIWYNHLWHRKGRCLHFTGERG